MLSPELIIHYSIVAAIAFLILATVSSMCGKYRLATAGLFSFFLCCTLFFGLRAYLKQFFPFTDKVESFVTLSVLIALCGLCYRKRVSNKEFTALLFLALASAVTIFVFDDSIRYPTAYLRTFWYPLHVPLSFAAYAFWFLAGIHSLFEYREIKNGETAGSTHSLVTDLNRNGFIVFSLAMIFGGIWGYLAWGSYFMWDSKLLWSVILWMFYGNLLHIDSLPRLTKWKTPLYLLGIVIILVTFIGTGFFSRSIHKF